MRRPDLRVLPLLAALALGCGAAPRPEEPYAGGALVAPAPCIPAPARLALDAFVRGRRAGYEQAMRRARAFLDGLEVDPMELRAAGLKGKKKLVEALDAYAILLHVAAPADRPALLARVEDLARPTREDAYHDLATIGERELHEDATSYLRAAFLLDRMGIDVRRYRQEIARVKGRLDRHLRARGPHQRRAFHDYYRHFGLEEPFPLDAALSEGLIARRADPDTLGRADVYALTHEVFAAYSFGDGLWQGASADEEPFDDGARLYLRGALPRLLQAARGRADPDLVAEVCACLRYLRFTGDPVYAEALGYLIDAQNADGSWGSYAAARARLGDRVKQGYHLHTTMVVVEALALGLSDTARRSEAPECR
jgi:hypothetical protein